MIPGELKQVARKANLDADDKFDLRVAFGIACIERVEHLLTDNTVVDALSVGKKFLAGACSRQALKEAAAKAAKASRSQSGTNSLDGAGSAAVSVSYGVAAALSGSALRASEYAAYASVYAYASHAVTDQDAYKEEHGWQIRKLRYLAAGQGRSIREGE